MSQRHSRSKVRYAFDESNHLIIDERGGPGRRLRSVQILDGTLTTDRHNHLVYHVDAPASAEDGSAPHTINLDGTWHLTANHELALTLHESDRQERQTLYVKGAVVSAEANALVFALRRNVDEDLRTAQRLTLSGRWRADEANRLNFFVEKGDGVEDRLTFQGGWELGERHALSYRYRQLVAGRRGQDEHALIFEGAWDITKADRLVYRLIGSSDSAFEFRASLRSPSLLAREGRIAYQVGIGLSRGKVRQERVTLFGAWKLNRDLSVSFEIPYGDGRVQAIRFEGDARLSPRDRIAVALRNSQREGLGLTVTFTRNLVPDANLFIELRKDTEERSVIGGVQVKF